jgi:hypothetical protein
MYIFGRAKLNECLLVMEFTRIYKTRLFHCIAIAFIMTTGCTTKDKVLFTAETPEEIKQSISIPAIDLDGDTYRQIIVDKEEGQYLGHVTTVLLEDGKTIYAVYPKGHGQGPVVMKRSSDGGLTWSDRLPVPDNWATSREVPTIHRVVDPQGVKRLILWSGLYPARLAISEDDGKVWSDLKPAGEWGGIVVMGFVEPLQTGKGHYIAMFHDDGRFINGGDGKFWGSPAGERSDTMVLYQTFSYDGGLTWSYPDTIWYGSDINLCEPGVVRSPDGKHLAVLLRENRRNKNSFVIFSEDEGKTWSDPRELPLSLTGDRHTAKYGPDGRLFISFRAISPDGRRDGRPFETDWAGWVGTWDDITGGNEGQYVVRIKENKAPEGRWEYDTAYPGVEVLPDGTFVVTTYGFWDKGEEPYILSVRFKLDELDDIAN